MLTFLGSIWWLIVTLGVLVTFHEFGHFWVARRLGVKVLRFSVGFGKPIWSRTGRDGCEYCIAPIPLGGYCKMLDAREGDVPEAERDREFTGKPIWKRFAIVAAGPIFNLAFAVLAFWVMFMVGRPGMVPVVAPPAAHTLAAEAGFHGGDRIQSIGGKEVPTWGAALDTLGSKTLSRKPTRVRVHRHDGREATLLLPLQQLSSDVPIAKAFSKIGLQPQAIPAVVARVESGMPAARAGLQAHDRVLAIDGRKISNFQDIGKKIKALAKPGKALDFRVRRHGAVHTIPVTPERTNPGDGGGTRWIIGVAAQRPQMATMRYGPATAMGKAVANTWDKTATTFEMIGKMVVGKASTRDLSGVITIARAADTSAHRGFAWFVSFLALVSLSLGVINLLPIPILDGGHLLYYLIELVKGRPVSERTMVAGQFLGMALIAALLGLTFYNDILRLIS